MILTLLRRSGRGQAVLLAAAAVFFLLAPLPQPARQPAEHAFEVSASGAAFSPAVLKVQPGDRVTITFTALDVAHGLSIDGQPLDLEAEPGQSSSATFTAGRAGTFRMRCSLACGNLHPFMLGTFQVGPNQVLWRSVGLAGLAAAAASWKALKR